MYGCHLRLFTSQKMSYHKPNDTGVPLRKLKFFAEYTIICSIFCIFADYNLQTTN